MRLVIAAVSTRLPDWVNIGIEDYLHRLPREFAVQIHEIRPASRAGRAVETCLSQEAARIEKLLPTQDAPVVLAEEGRQLSSSALARQLERWRDDGCNPTFIIGGADGVTPALKQRAGLLLSLSTMTLPHALARLLLVEQLYRAVSIVNGHPYHRA